jgi:hypothetical protein
MDSTSISSNTSMVLSTVQGNGLQVHPTASSSVVSPVNAQIWQVAGQRDPHMGPFSNIPADILYNIAQLASPIWPLSNLVLVCKRWRDILLFAPLLWTDIYIEFPSSRPPSAPSPERLASAALRRAGKTAKLCLHLNNLDESMISVTTVLGMISARGYQFIRKLTLEGSWQSRYGEKPVLPHLVGEWESLLHLNFEANISSGTALSPLVDCLRATAPALRHISIKKNSLSAFEKKLSTKSSLVNLDIYHTYSYHHTPIFSVWRSIKSLKSQATTQHNSPVGNPLDLRAIDPAKGDRLAFPSLNHGVFINHTLKFRSIPQLESLTDLVLIHVDIDAIATRSVEMPSLRRLVADNTRGIDCIIAPMLENLSVGPLREPVGVNVASYLSKLFSGHTQQLDPVHLDLRAIYTWYDAATTDTTVPLISLFSLRRVERISIARLTEVRETDLCKYRKLQSANIEDGSTVKELALLPKWKELDLGEDDAPDWLCDIIAHRQVAEFPVKLNLAPPSIETLRLFHRR